MRSAQLGFGVFALLLTAMLTQDARAASLSSVEVPGLEDAITGRTEFDNPALPSVAMAGVLDPEQYIVGPGDVFVVNYTGRVTRGFNAVVGPEGALQLPGIGVVDVAGLSLARARARVLQRGAATFRGVDVGIRLAHVRTLRVFLTGEVRRPGPLEVLATSRVSSALSDSMLTSRASRRNIVIHRRPLPGGQSVNEGGDLHADLELFARTGDPEGDPVLLDGDVLNVPIATRFVRVEGAVGRPGVYELGSNDSLGTLVRLAGGTLPSALDERALLVRWVDATHADSQRFSLADLREGRFDPTLRDGDQLFVYSLPRFHLLERAAILGEVRRPGTYPLQQNQTRLSQLVESAGGFLDRADLSTIRVYRASTSSEADMELDRLSRLSRTEMTSSEYEVLRARLAARREDYRVDWARLKGSRDLDLILRDGDVVRVDPVLASVRVEGEVRRPGLIEHVAGRSIGQYVSLAGGFARHADRAKVRITRAVTGQNLSGRDVSEIAPGDLIWVPERADATVWQHLQTLVAVAAQVATVVIAVRR